jgi:hypothetical protein
MKRLLFCLVLAATWMTALTLPARACDPRPRVIRRPTPAAPAAPTPQAPRPANPNPGTGEDVDWDLPADTSKEPAPAAGDRRSTTKPVTPRPAAAPTAPAPATGSFSDRVTQAVALKQALAAQNARLKAKWAELDRWDATAQEKFRRAFGSSDEQLRGRVMDRIEQLIDRNNQSIAAISENLNFEFFLQSKKRK